MVLASDGLWDVVEENELKAYEHLNANEIAKKLVELALERGSKDNISVQTMCRSNPGKMLHNRIYCGISLLSPRL